MGDNSDLVKRLRDNEAGMHFPRDILYDAAVAIEALEARVEKAEAHAQLIAEAAAKVEADLAAARACIRWYSSGCYPWDQTHAPAIAAARAEGGE